MMRSTRAPGTVLVVDDEPGICRSLSAFLESEGHRTITAASGEEALDLLRDAAPDVAFVDLRLPGMDGLQLLERLRESRPGLSVVLITAYGDIDIAIRATQGGAYSYLPKPFDLDDVATIVRRVLDRRPVAIVAGRGGGVGLDDLVLRGRSRAVQALKSALSACSSEPAPLLLVGEPSSGRESSARWLHARLGRAPDRFFRLRGGDGDRETIRHRIEISRARAGGTAFLSDFDALGEAEQEDAFEAAARGMTGGGPVVMASVRTPDPGGGGAARQRMDRAHQLGWSIVPVPPLRERLDDLPEILPSLLDQVGREIGRPLEGLDDDALAALRRQPWRGNFRELANVLRAAAVRTRGAVIEIDSLPAPSFEWR